MQLELMVGPIASGKSTYARERAEQGALIVNDDAIVNCVHGGVYKQYSKKLKHLYKMIEYQIIYAAFNNGRDCVIDRPCYKAATRARYVSLANSLDIPSVTVLFRWEGVEVHADRRMQSDCRGYSRDYWINTYNAHLAQFEPIQPWEKFERIVHV